MKYDLSILFYLKKSQEDKKGMVPVYMRITVNSVRTELSTNRKIEFLKWDNDSQRAKGRSEEAKTFNNHLDNLETKVKQDYNYLMNNNIGITSNILRDLLGGVNQTKHFLIKIFETNNELIKKEVNYKYSPRTIGQYSTVLERLKIFIHEEYKAEDFELDKLDLFFIRKFEIFLKQKYSIEHNTIMKYLKELKKVVHFAQKLGYIARDPFLGHQTAFKEFPRGYLTQEELARIEYHNFKIKRLDRVKDVFLFVCYTGFSYSDLFLLTPECITKGIDCKNWIIYEREKTGVRASIPILNQAQVIIDKYKDDPECQVGNKLLPVISNQKLNTYLSEIADVCDINKHITMHLGRHTFATTVTLTNGVPIETVSKMLGHTSIKTTQIYSKVVDTKISSDMQSLEKKLTANNLIRLKNAK